jgi:UDP-N-acetylmuramoylalanine--D-glutamate ligase
LKIDRSGIKGAKVTVMGLGINGGGLASALFFARHGAEVTVTDLRSASVLRDSVEGLRDYPVRYVLERHDEKDFTSADVVIKNPAVPPTSPFLTAARERGVAVETDLSVFLSMARNPILAVTGSKGKSTTASAMAFGLSRVFPGARLGGNITVSPLAFIDELDAAAPVVLELSSWQLGDLKGRGLLAPSISAFTVILPDHLDKYAGMDPYVADKKAIFQEQRPDQKAVFNLDDPWQRDFPGQTKARSWFYSAAALPGACDGAWLEEGGAVSRLDAGGREARILGSALLPGNHNRMNLLCAGLVLHLYGIKAEVICKALAEFPGVEHRLEMFREWKGIRFYNDSAATIPHATIEALKSLPAPVVLIAGGTDKNIDFSPLSQVAGVPSDIVLLAGTGSEKIRGILDEAGVSYDGPYPTLAEAVGAAMRKAAAAAGEKGASILFSPGCTSFGMFLNEFDRGRRFKETVAELTSAANR